MIAGECSSAGRRKSRDRSRSRGIDRGAGSPRRSPVAASRPARAIRRRTRRTSPVEYRSSPSDKRMPRSTNRSTTSRSTPARSARTCRKYSPTAGLAWPGAEVRSSVVRCVDGRAATEPGREDERRAHGDEPAGPGEPERSLEPARRRAAGAAAVVADRWPGRPFVAEAQVASDSIQSLPRLPVLSTWNEMQSSLSLGCKVAGADVAQRLWVESRIG